MHRFPQIGSPLHVEPEIRAVAEHPGENESCRRGHVAAIVAQLIDVLALHPHGFSQRAAARGISLSSLVNTLLRKDIELIDAAR